MGKQRRHRRKFHLEAKTVPNDTNSNFTAETETAEQPLMKIEGNIFGSLNINVDSLNKKLPDDLQSVKSLKSELGKNVSKKDRLKLRREMFLQKFEVMKQMKDEKKLLEKRKSTPVVGDMNPLHDALPSLESLLKNRTNVSYKSSSQPKKVKGIEKPSKQKRNHLQGIKTFQQIYKNKQFQNDPQSIVSQHIKTMLEQERSTK